MKEKTILITGGTSGVGKATVEKLAIFGSKIVLLARNKEKAHQVVAEIKAKNSSANIDFIEGDLSSLQSIKKAADEFKSKYDSFDILINNAGGIFSDNKKTVDGFEWGFQVNHLAHFLLTNLLLDVLMKSEEPRIINLASEIHRMGKLNLADLNCQTSFGGWKQYGATKLMNVMFAKSLANKYGSKGLKSFSLHPGVVKTAFGANNSGLLAMFNKMPFLITPEKGAETSIYLATQKADKLMNGGYYKKCMVSYSSLESQDVDKQENLWQISYKLLKDKGLMA